VKPDVVALDLALPDTSGIEVARKIRARASGCRILFLSVDYTPELVSSALRSGGTGFMAKTDAGSELIPALRAVLKGESYVSSSCRPRRLEPGQAHRAER
jgi:two-component system uhpT operon response regulator UhpA